MMRRSLNRPALPTRHRRMSRRPLVERLEERIALSTLTESPTGAAVPRPPLGAEVQAFRINWLETRRHERTAVLRGARLTVGAARQRSWPSRSGYGLEAPTTALGPATVGIPIMMAPVGGAAPINHPAPPTATPTTTLAPPSSPTMPGLVHTMSKPTGGGSSAPDNTNLGPPGTITTSNNGSQTSSAQAVTIDTSGDIIVAGSGTISGTRGFQVDRYTPAGALDTTFGTGGGVNTAVGSYKSFGTYSDSRATAVAILPGGDILAAGNAKVGTGRQEVALVFYTPSGKLDTTKGGGTGKVITPVGTGNDLLGSLLLQTVNGVTKILVAGTYYGNSSYGQGVALARYNLDGTLDTSFGSAGTLSWTIPGTAGFAEGGLAIDSSGRILVAGTADDSNLIGSIFISRWNSNGTAIDTTFGNGAGYVLHSDGGTRTIGNGLALQPDGKIVVGGGTGSSTVVFRYNTHGSPDPTFGSGGEVALAGGPGTEAVEILGNGDILLTNGAYYGPYANESFGLAWLTSGGALDTNFGGGTGIVTTELPESVFPLGLNPLAIQSSDGKILEVGTYGSTPNQFALARYNSDGSLDTSF
jgi:uncharacterized delta-60 repeat protein